MDDRYRDRLSGLYLEMYPLLFEYARSSLLNNALAEEAVQDTFIVACQKADALFASPNPKGWLVNTLKNVLSNIRRSRDTAARILAECLETEVAESIATKDDLDLRLLYGDLAQTEEFRLMTEMVLEGKSCLEMAQSRNIRVDTCRKRIQRAKEFLRKKVKL